MGRLGIFGDGVDRMLGDPKKAIISMALIMAISLAASRINIFVDTMWVSRLGVDATSAVFIVKPLYIMISCLGVGLGIGASTCISYHLGKGETEKAERMATNTLAIGLVISLGVTVLLLVLEGPIITFIGGEQVREEVNAYMFPLALCASALVAVNILTSLLKAEGAAWGVTISVMVGVAINAALDPLLIFQMDMGLAGAAWGTCISSICTIVLIRYWYCTNKLHLHLGLLRRPTRGNLSEIMSVGIPRSFEEFMSGFILMFHRVILIVVAGIAAVTIHQMAFLYLDLLMIIPDAIGSATLPVCSSAVGQNDEKRLREGIRLSILLSLAASSVCALAIYIFAEPLLDPFMDSNIHFYYRTILFAARMYFVFLPLYVLTKLMSYLLQAIRRSREAAIGNFVLGLIKLAAFSIPLILGVHDFSVIVWSVMAGYVSAGLFMVMLTWYYYRKLDMGELVGRISNRYGKGPSVPDADRGAS